MAFQISEGNEAFGIVVGLDGSDGSRSAMRWAATHAERFGPIQPVVAWRYPWWLVPNPFPAAPSPPPAEQFQRRAEHQARAEIASLGIDHVAEPIVCQAAAGPALVTLGARANLIAVGTRGRDAVRGTLLGSTGMHLVANATAPAVIVPRHLRMTPNHGRVVVGVDGSSNSILALRWAIQNTPDDVQLLAVTSYLDPVDLAVRPDGMAVDLGAADADRVLRQSIEAARDGLGSTSHHVTPRVLCGEAREVLRDAADDASLLVVGTRGHRGVAHLILGSTTDALVRNPHIPTVVVPLLP